MDKLPQQTNDPLNKQTQQTKGPLGKQPLQTNSPPQTKSPHRQGVLLDDTYHCSCLYGKWVHFSTVPKSSTGPALPLYCCRPLLRLLATLRPSK